MGGYTAHTAHNTRQSLIRTHCPLRAQVPVQTTCTVQTSCTLYSLLQVPAQYGTVLYLCRTVPLPYCTVLYCTVKQRLLDCNAGAILYVAQI